MAGTSYSKVHSSCVSETGFFRESVASFLDVRVEIVEQFGSADPAEFPRPLPHRVNRAARVVVEFGVRRYRAGLSRKHRSEILAIRVREGCLRRMHRDVRHALGDVKEEGPVLVAPDEIERALGIAPDQLVLVDPGVAPTGAHRFDGGLILDQEQLALDHVIAIRQTEILIEPLAGREELGASGLVRGVAEAPFADHAGCRSPAS